MCVRDSNDENVKSGEIFGHFLDAMNELQVNDYETMQAKSENVSYSNISRFKSEIKGYDCKGRTLVKINLRVEICEK